MIRPDTRYIRAMRLNAAVMHRLGPILDEPEIDLYREVSCALLAVLMEEGVEALTDYDRQEVGLPPRGPDGWTIEEMIAMEKKRLEALMVPLLEGGRPSGVGIYCTGAYDPYLLRARKQDPCDFETGWNGSMRLEPEKQR